MIIHVIQICSFLTANRCIRDLILVKVSHVFTPADVLVRLKETIRHFTTTAETRVKILTVDVTHAGESNSSAFRWNFFYEL